MKGIIFTAMVLFASVSFAEVNVSGKQFYGVGAYTCEMFRDAYEKKDAKFARVKDWVQGYVTYHNVVNQEQWALDFDRDIAYVYSECRDTPKQPMVFTLNNLVAQ